MPRTACSAVVFRAAIAIASYSHCVGAEVALVTATLPVASALPSDFVSFSLETTSAPPVVEKGTTFSCGDDFLMERAHAPTVLRPRRLL